MKTKKNLKNIRKLSVNKAAKLATSELESYKIQAIMYPLEVPLKIAERRRIQCSWQNPQDKTYSTGPADNLIHFLPLMSRILVPSKSKNILFRMRLKKLNVQLPVYHLLRMKDETG